MDEEPTAESWISGGQINDGQSPASLPEEGESIEEPVSTEQATSQGGALESGVAKAAERLLEAKAISKNSEPDEKGPPI